MISRNDTIEAPIAKLNQPPILAEIEIRDIFKMLVR